MIPLIKRQIRRLSEPTPGKRALQRERQAEMAVLALNSAGYQVIELRPELNPSRKWETTLRAGNRDILTTFGFDRLEALQRAIGAVGVEEAWSS